MRLFWTLEALDDRRAIYDYMEADNPRAALMLDALFSEKVRIGLITPDLVGSGASLARVSWWFTKTTF